jgi:hypothetical protein
MDSQPPSAPVAQVEPTIENLIKNNNNYKIFRKLKGLCDTDGNLTEKKETEYNKIVDKIIKQYAKAGFNGTKPPTFINWVHKHIPSFSQSSIKCLKFCFTRFQEEALHSWSPAMEKADSDK